MNLKRMCLYATAISILALASVPAYSQFPTAPGNESMPTFGSFEILVNPEFAKLFTGCPAASWDPATRIFSSPTLYDPATVIGVSAATKEGEREEEEHGIPVGTGPSVLISDRDFHRPRGFPEPPKGTPEVHTQIRTLNMTTYGGGPPVTVTVKPPEEKPYSAGEVYADSRTTDFPARSFFDVYVQIKVPACGAFKGGTLHNDDPMTVEATGLTSLPPQPGLVYDHSSTSEVPILMEDRRVLGCIILASHGVTIVFRGPRPRPEEVEEGRKAFEKHVKDNERRLGHPSCEERRR